jgi:hypothetical protein
MKFLLRKAWLARKRRDIGVVGRYHGDLKLIAAALGAKPVLFTERATRFSPRIRYSALLISLAKGAPAALVDYLDGKPLELRLETADDRFVFECDLLELVTSLQLQVASIEKFENFTWLPNRSSKRAVKKSDAGEEKFEIEFSTPHGKKVLSTADLEELGLLVYLKDPEPKKKRR